MKLHKINFNKVFNLKLLKTKVYTKQKKINHNKNKMVELHLKKAFSIIYKYHTTNKKILFIGTPVNKNQQFNHLLLNTNHIFISNLTICTPNKDPDYRCTDRYLAWYRTL